MTNHRLFRGGLDAWIKVIADAGGLCHWITLR
jgi:hypothetical protein